jgi:transposase
MPAPLSSDLRCRVIAAWQANPASRASLPQLFRIAPATLTRWIALFRQTGSVEPRPHGGGASALIPNSCLGIVLTLAQEHPDATLGELCDDYACCTDQSVSIMTLDRALDRLELTRKKKHSAPASETAPTSCSARSNTINRSARFQ